MKLNHLVIIPDGNRRWAKKRDLHPWQGHEEGSKVFQKLTKHIIDSNIKYFTFWAMSYDNLIKRPRKEILVLTNLIGEGIKAFYKENLIKDKKVNIRFYGDWKRHFNKKLTKEMEKIEEATKKYNSFYISILIAYDGQVEITEAMKSLGKERCSQLNFKKIRKHLWTKDLPDVDLIIRTGIKNDPHLSGNMLMFQTGYSQLYFTPTLWPDFNEKELMHALDTFEKNERKLGK